MMKMKQTQLRTYLQVAQLSNQNKAGLDDLNLLSSTLHYVDDYVRAAQFATSIEVLWASLNGKSGPKDFTTA
jgi:hypothetical protein